MCGVALGYISGCVSPARLLAIGAGNGIDSLSDGSAVVITVGILLDNEGKNWNGTGLTPDVDASLTNDEQSSYYDFTVDSDPQITKAINAISGANGQ